MANRYLDDNIIYLIASFSHQFSRALSAAFHRSNLPITPEQFGVLMLLAYEDGINQQEISFRLERDKTTVTRMLANLVNDGLIRTRPDITDSRARIVHLTAAGRKLQEDAASISAALYIQALEGVSGREIDQAISFLQRLNTSIKQIR